VAHDTPGNTPHLPDPTPWPMVLALGMTLLAAGLVTTRWLSVIGLIVLGAALYRLIMEDVRQQRAAGHG